MKKLCIIGCGGIGTYHLGHFLDYKDIELVGFCDLVIEKAEAFVKRAGQGKAYTDYKVMYDEVKPDMVFICVPPYCHGEIEFETIARGIPMFIEKPVALDLDLAYKIRDAIEQAHLITAVGFQCRYADIVDRRLVFNRQKTGKLLSFQLQSAALDILDKYRQPNAHPQDYIFPVLRRSVHVTAQQQYGRVQRTNKRINRYLKLIGEHLHLPITLTTYVARHSFATVLKRSGVSTSIISESLGHSSEKITQIYLDSFENSQIDAAMQNLL